MFQFKFLRLGDFLKKKTDNIFFYQFFFGFNLIDFIVEFSDDSDKKKMPKTMKLLLSESLLKYDTQGELLVQSSGIQWAHAWVL